MMFLGPLMFLLFFALMSGTVRGKTAECIGTVSHWINVNEPFSYLVVILVLMAPALSALLIASWPRTPEADNPLLQYRRDHPDMMDQ
jgi:hypothetical protein